MEAPSGAEAKTVEIFGSLFVGRFVSLTFFCTHFEMNLVRARKKTKLRREIKKNDSVKRYVIVCESASFLKFNLFKKLD